MRYRDFYRAVEMEKLTRVTTHGRACVDSSPTGNWPEQGEKNNLDEWIISALQLPAIIIIN